MSNKTAQHFYEEIRFLTDEIARLKVADKFIKAARRKRGNINLKVVLLFEKFKNENPELWERMETFFDQYKKERRPTIFFDSYGEEKEGLFKYKPEEINPINLCFLMIFGDGALDDDDIFINCDNLCEALEETQPQFAKYIPNSYMNSLDDLINALKEN